MSERGQHEQDFPFEFDGAEAKNYVMFAAQYVHPTLGNLSDPDGEYEASHLTINFGTGTGTGTLQFFKEHVETGVASAVSPVIPIDETHSHLSLPVKWRPGPEHDVYMVVTGTAGGTGLIRAHRISNSYRNGLEISL